MSSSSSSSSHVSYQMAATFLFLSALVAALARFSWSPLSLLLLAPFALLGSTLAFLLVDLYLTWWIERKVLQRLASKDGGGSSPATTHAAHRRPISSLVFASPAAWSVTQTRASWEAAAATSSGTTTTSSSRRPPPFPSADPQVSSALDHLLQLILRDFVNKWYSNISDSPAFPSAVERTIHYALGALVTRVEGVDWSDVLVGQILPLVTDHVDNFRSAEHALRGHDLRTQLTESDELDLFLASRYASATTSGKLHPAVDVASPNSRPAEEAWLSGVVGRILPFLLPEREWESGAVRTIVRELVACAVILPIVDMMSDPDFWNRMIDDKVRFPRLFDARDSSRH